MKNKLYISILLCVATLSYSCSDQLSVEKYFDDRLSHDHIFRSRDYTEQWLATAYFSLLAHNLEIGHINYTNTNFADDCTYNEGASSAKYSVFKYGSYTPNSWSGSWKLSWEGIRQASILIHNVDKNEEMSKREIDDTKGQAYFLRGYLYWLLLRKHGPIPILPDEGLDYNLSYDDLSIPRSTYDECVDYIAEQMKIAAELLEKDRDSKSIVRPTVGAALAVRAKAYLYAASPLANGNPDMTDFVDDEGKELISKVYNEEKWARAAAACKDVIDLRKYELYTANLRTTGTYIYPKTVVPPYHPEYSDKKWPEGWADIDPYDSYRSLFNGDLQIMENPEVIFTRGNNQTDPIFGIESMTRHQMPQHLGGYNAHGATGKQADAYAMHTGVPFDVETSEKGFVTKAEVDAEKYAHVGVGVWKEYTNREPRFYASIAYSGSFWAGANTNTETQRNKQSFYYRGETDGRQASGERWLPTGIGMMKYVNPKDAYVDGGKGERKFDPAIRYADILLMYAEALNELTSSYQIPSWNGTTTYTITRNVEEMRTGIRPIRVRAGIPDLAESVYGDAANLRTAIKHERQIELFAENQRYYDLRRWKDAEVEENKPIYGCNTFMSKTQAEYFYERVVIPEYESRFSRKMYFWPIMYSELQRNKRLTQAPGWQTYD